MPGEAKERPFAWIKERVTRTKSKRGREPFGKSTNKNTSKTQQINNAPIIQTS